MKSRVAVVDDHNIVRAGLLSMLARDSDIEAVGEFDSAERLLASLDAITPDIVLLDFRLPGINGAAACREILARRPDTAVALLTSFYDDATIQACLNAGARAFLLKGMPVDEILAALHSIARGETVLAPDIVGRVVGWTRRASTSTGPDEGLTPHELDVLALVAQGLTYRHIAHRLAVSEGSVKLYMRSSMRKLGARERSEAVVTAIRRGLI